jgi:hypothetical protein
MKSTGALQRRGARTRVLKKGDQQLNAIGAEGWELANIVWRPKNCAGWRKDWADALVFCIFKRRVANTTDLTSERGWSAASPPAFFSGRKLRYVRRLMRGGAGGKQPNQRSTATTTRARMSASRAP